MSVYLPISQYNVSVFNKNTQRQAKTKKYNLKRLSDYQTGSDIAQGLELSEKVFKISVWAPRNALNS